MIDIIIPFMFGLMIGAGGGVMIAALLVASKESEKIAKGLTEGHDLIRRDDAIEAVYTRIKQIGLENDPYVLSIRQAIRDMPAAQPEIIHCNACKHWKQTCGEMKGFGLGECDNFGIKLVTCDGFCYWAEREKDERY